MYVTPLNTIRVEQCYAPEVFNEGVQGTNADGRALIIPALMRTITFDPNEGIVIPPTRTV